MRTPADVPRRAPRTSRRFRIGVLVAIVAIIIILSTARGLASFYVSYLWFREVHFESVFRGVLVTKILLAVVFCILFFVLMFASLMVADRFAPDTLSESGHDELVERYRDLITPHGRWLRVGVAAIFALFAGIGANSQWNNWDLFRYGVNFNATDPVFHKNVGFYVFQLPFIKFLLSWSFGAVVVILLVTATALYLNGGIRFQGSGQRVTAAVKTHISVLLGVLAVIQAFGYYYERFELVLAKGSLIDGADNTDLHAHLPADDLLIVIAIIAAALFLVNTRVRGWTLPVVAVIVWAVVWVVAGNIYPALYQALRVNPSELTRESKYIQRNIDATRVAYGLNDVKVASTDFDGNQTVTTSAVKGATPLAASDRETLDNIQLLDPNQVVNTFEKLQALRSFYDINALSVGRYDLSIDGKDVLTETLTGVRELGSVPGGFTNSKLIYTHGYGAAVAPATEQGVESNGSPEFTLENVPPTSSSGGTGEPALSEEGAQVYYGEGSSASGFVIADSKQKELDYPTATSEVSTHYAGSGGVPVDNVLRRLAFSLSFDNLDILLSGQITDKSRVIYNRNILERVKKAAPFLKYDSDPYAVIVKGQIYWIVDAYTTTANYPYSEDADTTRVSSSSGLSGTFNYVRNSVKVVVNAYTGKMDYFVVDPSDPIIKVYEKAFPDLFIPSSKADDLIPGITAQFRYPEDLFEVQTNMYGRYHLTSPSAFYTEANAWNISQDPGSGAPGSSTTQYTINADGGLTASTKELDPEYEVAALPGSSTQNFLILQPFVPYSPTASRQNLTAVMFATSNPDGSDSTPTVYETPPGEQVNGPELITSEINANTQISAQFSLLDQHGSSVELGEVVTVPLDNTLLYVQPVYVESTTNQVPELKDVIVVYNNMAYLSGNSSLDAALCDIGGPFGNFCNTAAANRPSTLVNSSGNSSTPSSTTTTTTTPTTTPTTPTAVSGTAAQLLGDAKSEFAAANTALSKGDLGTYATDVKKAEADVTKADSEVPSSSTSSTTTTTSPPTKKSSSASSSTTTTTTPGG